MRLRLDVIPTGKTTATVILSQEQVDAIRGSAGRARVPLAITFRGATFRTSVSVYRGEWMMVVNKEMRDGGLEPGGSFDVDVKVDKAERTVDVPPELTKALKAAKVQKAFDALSFTRRKEFARLVAEAKKPETREARIDKIITELLATS